MTKRDYQKLAAPFLKSPKKRKALIVSDLVLTGLV